MNGLARTFNWHYPEGYEQLPKGSIYSWASKVHPSKPTGIGEFLACPWVEKIKPDVFWWHGTWSRGLRYVNFTDIRPFVMTWAWDDKHREAKENLRRSLSPVALFDKAYDDLGIEPLMTAKYPSLKAGLREKRTLVLYNDEFSGTELTVEVQLAAGGRTYASGKRDYTLALGEHRDLPIAFQAPAAKGTLELAAHCPQRPGGQVRRNQAVPDHRRCRREELVPKIELGDLQPCSIPDDRRTTVSPKEIDGPLVNPYCGWGIWAGSRFFDSRQFSIDYNTKGFGDDAPLFSWMLIDWMWSDLEPKEGQFDWKNLDTVVAYWQA